MDIRIQENHVVFRAIFLAMCMSAVSHVWAAQFTAPATGVLTSHNQRACLSWHILHNIMCHKLTNTKWLC